MAASYRKPPQKVIRPCSDEPSLDRQGLRIRFGVRAFVSPGGISFFPRLSFYQATAGPIDIFVANAGIPCNGGYEVPNDEWDRIFKVHVWEAQSGLGNDDQSR